MDLVKSIRESIMPKPFVLGPTNVKDGFNQAKTFTAISTMPKTDMPPTTHSLSKEKSKHAYRTNCKRK